MKTILSVLIILFSVLAFGQKTPPDYFDEACNYFEDNQYDEALKGFQYIVDNHPNNKLYPRSFFNIGFIYFSQKDYDKAIPVFKKILNSDFDEKENSGGGIMDDPYANYRHRASIILSDIYFERQMYDTSLYYFIKGDIDYPYLHFCGNELDYNEVYKALRYSEIYQILNLPDKAVEKLLAAVFIELADNSEVIEELRILLTGKTGLKTELDNALNKMYRKTERVAKEKYWIYYIKFLNVEMVITYWNKDNEMKFDTSGKIDEIKQSDFYKMIEAL